MSDSEAAMNRHTYKVLSTEEALEYTKINVGLPEIFRSILYAALHGVDHRLFPFTSGNGKTEKITG